MHSAHPTNENFKLWFALFFSVPSAKKLWLQLGGANDRWASGLCWGDWLLGPAVQFKAGNVKSGRASVGWELPGAGSGFTKYFFLLRESSIFALF